LAEVT